MTTVSDISCLEDLFGEDAPLTAQEFRARVTARISRGIKAAGDAYEYSHPYSDGHTYGTNRWRFVLAETGQAFQGIGGVKPLASGGLMIPIVPLGCAHSVLVYPLCLANDAVFDPQFVRVRTSRLRRLLFTRGPNTSGFVQGVLFSDLGQPAMPVPTPDPDELDAELAEDDAALAQAEALMATSAESFRTLIAGYASNPRAGLLRLIVGEAEISPDGTLTFGWLEELPLLSPDGPGLRLAEEDEVIGFDDAPEPLLDVTPL